MKKSLLKSALLVGSIGAGLLATDAQAQVFNPSRGNMLFGARELDGAARGPFDIVVDLGSAQRFDAASTTPILLGGANGSYGGVAAVSENRFSPASVSSTFGGLDNVLASAFGVNSAVSATANTSWFLTRARTDQDVQSTPWTRFSTISQGGAGNRMEQIRGNAISAGVDFNGTSTLENSASTSSYGNAAMVPFTGYAAMEANTGSSFSGGAFKRLDLYNVRATSVAPTGTISDYIGYFEYQADGDLWYIPENFTPIPEPSTYGLVAGAGLLAMAIRRKLAAKNA